jgi:uncharacterized membrane protein
MAAEDKEVQEGKGIAWLAYFGILFLVPLLAAKDNKFAKFHGKQGMVFCIGAVVISIALFILTFIFGFIPYVGWVLDILLWLAYGILFFVLAIIGIIQALSGKYWKMPILGGIAEKLKI